MKTTSFSKFNTLNKKENKSQWQMGQERQGHYNPQFFLQASVVENPWQKIKQYEATVLQGYIPSLDNLKRAGYRYDTPHSGKKKQYNYLLNQSKLQRQQQFFQELNK